MRAVEFGNCGVDRLITKGFFSMPRLIAALALLMLGCSSKPSDKTIGWSAQRLFEEAREEQKEGNYSTARDYYGKLLARYPHGTLAQQSALDLVYSYFKDGESEKALKELDSFMKTYPRHPQIDYAYYMKGVINYERNTTLLKRLSPLNQAQTDPNMLKRAFDAFKELLEKFPRSQYAEDAQQRMVYLRNLLGQHELEIAEHYLREGAYVAAIGRAQVVVTDYQNTPSTPYALALMSRAYGELGDDVRRRDNLELLRRNFPKMLNEVEIRELLSGDIKRKDSLLSILTAKPKI